MRVLPIVERELRVAARRRSAFWARIVAAAAAVFIGGVQLWFSDDWIAAARMGRSLFETLILLAFAFCLVAGPMFTADVLSEEKREGTLGLLFLTDLRAYDIILGKLAAASVTAVFSLLAVVPVLALSLLLGGVSLAEFGRMVLVLGNALWFSLAVGMAMSALCQEMRSAFALTGFVLFLAVVLVPWLLDSLANGPRLIREILTVLTPAGALTTAPAAEFAKDPAAFWVALAGTHLEAWLFLVAAGRFTGRAWREQTAFRLSEHWQRRWLNLLLGERSERHALRRRLLDHNPLLWLGSRHQLKRTLLWGLFAALLAAWMVARLLIGWDGWSAGMTILVAGFLQATLKWLAASEAAFRFSEDRRSGALELLLTTGLDEPQIVRGSMLAMRRLFGVPAAALLVVETGMLLSDVGTPGGQINDWLPAVAAMAMFVWDMPTLAWAGMWYSVSGRRPQYASLRAIFRVLFVPWLVFFAVLFVVGVWNWLVVALLWLIVCGGNNWQVRKSVRPRLLREFRAAAAGQLRPVAAAIPANLPALQPQLQP